MSYSRPMFLSRTLEIVIDRVDRVTIGALLGDTATGLYSQARFVAEVGNVATRPLGQLGLNLYSRLQDQPARLARSYELVNYFLARLTLLGGSVLLVFPHETVRVLLGEAVRMLIDLVEGLVQHGGGWVRFVGAFCGRGSFVAQVSLLCSSSGSLFYYS